jgi:hypothetical protein
LNWTLSRLTLLECPLQYSPAHRTVEPAGRVTVAAEESSVVAASASAST